MSAFQMRHSLLKVNNGHFLRPLQGNPDSEIGEIFASGIRNPGKFCHWNPEYR